MLRFFFISKMTHKIIHFKMKILKNAATLMRKKKYRKKFCCEIHKKNKKKKKTKIKNFFYSFFFFPRMNLSTKYFTKKTR